MARSGSIRREARLEPIQIPKHERRFTGFDERIIAMDARGMSVREILAVLAERQGTDVSPDFISSVTDEVMAETLAWQSPSIEAMSPDDPLRRAAREYPG